MRANASPSSTGCSPRGPPTQWTGVRPRAKGVPRSRRLAHARAPHPASRARGRLPACPEEREVGKRKRTPRHFIPVGVVGVDPEDGGGGNARGIARDARPARPRWRPCTSSREARPTCRVAGRSRSPRCEDPRAIRAAIAPRAARPTRRAPRASDRAAPEGRCLGAGARELRSMTPAAARQRPGEKGRLHRSSSALADHDEALGLGVPGPAVVVPEAGALAPPRRREHLQKSRTVVESDRLVVSLDDGARLRGDLNLLHHPLVVAVAPRCAAVPAPGVRPPAACSPPRREARIRAALT